MSTNPIVQDEILALRRIQEFEESQFGPLNLGVGMWDFDRNFTINLVGGELHAEVDFYSQDFYRAHPDGKGEFDPEVWEDEKMHLSTHVTTQENFQFLYRVCRGLLNGKTVFMPDGRQFSRESYLAQVREGVAV